MTDRPQLPASYDADLTREPEPVTCLRHGGQWGDDLTCEHCTDDLGNPRPGPDMTCRHCRKRIRMAGRLPDRSPAYATPPGLDPAADGHPWYCDAEASGPGRRHEPGRRLCAHADQDGKGMHWLEPGDVCPMAEASGPGLTDARALDGIARILSDDDDWSADTINAIRDVVLATGRMIDTD